MYLGQHGSFRVPKAEPLDGKSYQAGYRGVKLPCLLDHEYQLYDGQYALLSPIDETVEKGDEHPAKHR